MNGLSSTTLDLCPDSNINVQCISMDITTVNSELHKVIDCKLGQSLDENNGVFNYDGCN